MKLLISVLLLIGSNAFATPTAGKVLKAQVLKMQTCSGKNSINGVDIYFSKENKKMFEKNVNTVSITVPGNSDLQEQFNFEDSYAYSVSDGPEDGLTLYTTWKVEGDKVLVWVQGEWRSLIIGFKSKTCWF